MKIKKYKKKKENSKFLKSWKFPFQKKKKRKRKKKNFIGKSWLFFNEMKVIPICAIIVAVSEINASFILNGFERTKSDDISFSPNFG